MLLGHARSYAVGSALSILLLLIPTSALCDEYQTQGQIGLSFSPDGWVHELAIEPFVPFDFYVLADLSADGGEFFIGTMEASLHYASQVAINETDVYGADVSSIFGLRPGELSMVWGADGCYMQREGLSPVLRVHAIVTATAEEILIGVDAVIPGSFDGIGPGWWDCFLENKYLFDQSSSGSHAQLSVVTNVAADEDSWSTLKASFRGEVSP